jgi:hypothetical protein
MGAPQQQLIMSNSPLESAFHHATKPVHKLNAVRELLDVKVNDPVTHDFSNEVKYRFKNDYVTFTCIGWKPFSFTG